MTMGIGTAQDPEASGDGSVVGLLKRLRTLLGNLVVRWGVASMQSFTIGSGATGALVAEVDLGKNYRTAAITCADAGGIDAATTVSAQVGYAAADTLVDLYEVNDPSTKWSKAVPDSGTFGFVLSHAFGLRRLRIVLSKVTTAPVTINVYGLDSSG